MIGAEKSTFLLKWAGLKPPMVSTVVVRWYFGSVSSFEIESCSPHESPLSLLAFWGLLHPPPDEGAFKWAPSSVICSTSSHFLVLSFLHPKGQVRSNQIRCLHPPPPPKYFGSLSDPPSPSQLFLVSFGTVSPSRLGDDLSIPIFSPALFRLVKSLFFS